MADEKLIGPDGEDHGAFQIQNVRGTPNGTLEMDVMIRPEALAFAPLRGASRLRRSRVLIWKCFGCGCSGFIPWEVDVLFCDFGIWKVRIHDDSCSYQSIFLTGFENGDPEDERQDFIRWTEMNKEGKTDEQD